MQMRRFRLVVMLAFLVVGAIFAQSTPQVIKLQGSLSQSGVGPVTGTVTMTFTLYDAPSGGTALVIIGPQSIIVSGGLYDVELPFPQSAFSGPERYVEVNVNGETLAPRVRLGSSPFAYVADRVDGHEGADLEESAEIDSKIVAHEVLADAHPVYVKKAGDTLTGNLQVGGTIESTLGGFKFPDGTMQTTAASSSGPGGNTLDQAYDQGGPGAGRTIVADAGAVVIAGTGGLSVHQELELRDAEGVQSFLVDVPGGNSSRVTFGSLGLPGLLQVRDTAALPSLEFNASTGVLGMWESDGPIIGSRTITFNSRAAEITVGALSSNGTIRVHNDGDRTMFQFDASSGILALYDDDGSAQGQRTISLDANTGEISIIGAGGLRFSDGTVQTTAQVQGPQGPPGPPGPLVAITALCENGANPLASCSGPCGGAEYVVHAMSSDISCSIQGVDPITGQLIECSSGLTSPGFKSLCCVCRPN